MFNKTDFGKKIFPNIDREKVLSQFKYAATPILGSGKVAEMKNYMQHGRCSCLEHCIAVSFYSFMLVNYLSIPCKRYSLIRAALLHDYFLYDWHIKDKSHSLHGFSHPRKSLQNAINDFNLNNIEKDIILRHMFPLVPIPPRTTEGIIVSLVDKICAINETLSPCPYKTLIKELFI